LIGCRSSVAQSVEQPAVNRLVVGSSPARGACEGRKSDELRPPRVNPHVTSMRVFCCLAAVIRALGFQAVFLLRGLGDVIGRQMCSCGGIESRRCEKERHRVG
jgi:hypothetical protein